METMGGTFYCWLTFLGLVVLFFIDASLKRADKGPKRVIEYQSAVIEGLLKTLESLGVYHIDSNADPVNIDGYTVYRHDKIGLIKFDFSLFSFYLPDEQVTEKGISGHDLHEIIIFEKKVANSNFLDFLLDHQSLIHESWPEELVFWGTIWEKDSKFYVRSLVKTSNGYISKINEVDSYFKSSQPALVID